LPLSSHLTVVQQRLLSQGFAPVTDLPPALAAGLALCLERREPWGRLVLAIPPEAPAGRGAARPELAAALAAYCQAQAAPAGAPVTYGLLACLITGGLPDAEAQAVLALRQDDPERRWGVIAWAIDLDLGLADRHRGFPTVPDSLQIALATPAVERRGPAPEFRTGPVKRAWRNWSSGGVPVTRLLIGGCVALYLWTVLAGGQGGGLNLSPGTDTLVTYGASVSRLVVGGGQNWRLLTAMFLHASLWHIVFNMWALWVLGQHVELLYDSPRMAFIYLIAGLAGGVASASLRSQGIVSVGASGAIFGLLGALLFDVWIVGGRAPDWRSLGMSLGVTFLFGLFINVDQLAHIGGFIGGFAAAWLVGAAGRRTPWRRWASLAVLLVTVLLLAGLIPVPPLALF